MHGAGRALFFAHPHYELAKYSEWPETCFAGALALFAFLSLRLLRDGGTIRSPCQTS